MRKFLLWSPAILFCAIVGVTLLGQFGWLENYSASLKMTNRSTAEIERIEVSLYQAACQVTRLEPGQSSVCILQIQSDAHYKIAWMEPNSSAYSERAGYVTHGFNFSHELDFLGQGKIDFRLVESH